MKPLRRVLVATDFTAGALRAARRALRLPLAPRATVELMHAAPRVSAADFEAAVEPAGLAALERQAVELLRRHGPPAPRIRKVLASGPPSEAVARETRAEDIELVVAGPPGKPGLPDLDLGSTAGRLLAESEVPVLIVRRPAHGPYRHALVAMAVGGGSGQALAFAMRLLGRAGGRITLLNVVAAPVDAAVRMAGTSSAEWARLRERDLDSAERFLAAEARRVVREGLAVDCLLAEGDARSVVLATARRLRVDLVALGASRAGDRTGLLLGSVAREVARRASCDVLVARWNASCEGSPRSEYRSKSAVPHNRGTGRDLAPTLEGS